MTEAARPAAAASDSLPGDGTGPPHLWLWIALAALAATLLRAAVGDMRGFWLDEYYTLRAAEMIPEKLIRDRVSAGHSPLYFFYAKWPLFFGREEWLLRLSSAVAVGVATIGAAGLFMSAGLRRYVPALLVVCVLQPGWFTLGTQYRYMMPLVAVSALALWAAHAFAARGWVWWRGLLLAALLSLLVWIHGSAQFIVFSILLFLLWERRSQDGRWRPAALGAALPVLAAFAASVPLAMLLRGRVSQAAEGSRIRFPSIGNTAKDLVDAAFGNHELFTKWRDLSDGVMLLPLLAILVAGGFGAWRLLRDRPDGRRAIYAMFLGFPLAILIASSFIKNAGGPARYFAAWSIPATMIVALAWYAPFRPLGQWALRIGILWCLSIQTPMTALERGDRHREAILYILKHRRVQDAVAMSTKNNNIYAFEYLGADVRNFAAIDGRTWDRAIVRQFLEESFLNSARGFLLLYHARGEFLDDPKTGEPGVVSELLKEGFFAGARRFDMGRATVVAVVREQADVEAWLNHLPPPDTGGPGSVPRAEE